MPRATAQGLDALTRIVAEEQFVPGEINTLAYSCKTLNLLMKNSGQLLK